MFSTIAKAVSAKIPSADAAADANFANVSLLLHGDGVQGSTTFSDSSPTPKTPTLNGSVNVTTIRSKFGGASINFAGGRLVYNADNSFILGASDATVEGWVYITANPATSYRMVAHQNGSSTNANYAYTVDINAAGKISANMFVNTTTFNALSLSSVTLNAWNHFAFVKSGNFIFVFLNGARGNPTLITGTVNVLATPQLIIGADRDGSIPLSGQLDDLRITKGTARYLTNFTVPTAAYPNSSTTRTYATWNPADKGGGVNLSNGNLTVSLATTPTDGGSVRSTIGKAAGKWYWEVTVGGTQSWSLPGVADATASIASNSVYVFSVGGYGYYTPTGTKYNNGGSSAYSTGASPGDVIGVALDMDAGTLTFYKNGVSMGAAFSGLAGTFYAAEGNYTLDVTQSTANFGATAFAYSVPSGFNAGLYN